MSSEDVNLASSGDDPLWFCWYAGPAREDDGPRSRVSITRAGEHITLSVEELERLVSLAGLLAVNREGAAVWLPTPYGGRSPRCLRPLLLGCPLNCGCPPYLVPVGKEGEQGD